MATRDKHRKRSHVSYAGEAANYRHWLMTRPYILPVGLKHFTNLINDIKEEAEDNKEE